VAAVVLEKSTAQAHWRDNENRDTTKGNGSAEDAGDTERGAQKPTCMTMQQDQRSGSAVAHEEAREQRFYLHSRARGNRAWEQQPSSEAAPTDVQMSDEELLTLEEPQGPTAPAPGVPENERPRATQPRPHARHRHQHALLTRVERTERAARR